MKSAIGKNLKGARHFLRVAGLAILFVWCAASSCYQTESDIQYAAGYGYVIHVTCKTNCKSPTAPNSYLIFGTYQEAADWLDKFQKSGQAWLIGGNYRIENQAEYPDVDGLTPYQKIAKLAGPPPNTYPTSAIELNQPQPFTPQ